MELITQLSAGGIFAILVIREVLGFITKNKLGASPKKQPDSSKLLYEMKGLLDDLHDWHNQKDADGVYVWYVRRSLEEAISKLADSSQQLADSIKLQTSVLDRIARGQDDLRKDIEELKRDK